MPGGEGVWIYFLLSKARHTELMQYLLPCLPAGRRLSLGPSSKTCPKCAPQSLHLTSVRLVSWLWSSRSSIFSKFAGSLKLGQPVPESNFASEEKSSAPQTAHLYIPCSWLFQYLPENGASVPPVRATRRNSGESSPSFLIGDFIFYCFKGKLKRTAGWLVEVANFALAHINEVVASQGFVTGF